MRKAEFDTILIDAGKLETVRRTRRVGSMGSGGVAIRQTTLAAPASLDGIGLHSGMSLRVTLRPAVANHGIIFRRIDLVDAGAFVSDIPASYDHVFETTLCTTISNAAGTSVSTIEHVMAAVSALGLDNALIEVDGPEVPVMDGSAENFVAAIESVGMQILHAPRRAIRILKPVVVEESNKRVALLPGEGFQLGFEIEFTNSAIGCQSIEADLHDPEFAPDILRARTFGFMKDVEAMQKAGLARGGSLENSLIFDGDRLLNKSGLRFADECVRHKVLDAVGDLALAGAPLIGRYEGVRAGHALNNRVLRALFADTSAWGWVEADEAALVVTVPRMLGAAVHAD